MGVPAGSRGLLDRTTDEHMIAGTFVCFCSFRSVPAGGLPFAMTVGGRSPAAHPPLARHARSSRDIPGCGGRAMKRSRRISIWFIVLGLAAAPSFAQVDTGAILGTVRDPSGGVLPGATVTLTHKQTGIATRTTTDTRGNYEAVGLAIGTYNVIVTLQGFRT